MIEIIWGKPIIFVDPPTGDTTKITTIEQSNYWLRKKWLVADHNRDLALEHIDAAMHCMATVSGARKAFILAAKTAGFMPVQMDTKSVADC